MRAQIPILSMDNTGLVNKSTTDERSFALFDPFTPELWGLLSLSMFLAAGFAVAIEWLPQEIRSCALVGALTTYGQACYHVWGLLLGGEAESPPATAAGRVLRLATNFIILVLVSTYTANLAGAGNVLPSGRTPLSHTRPPSPRTQPSSIGPTSRSEDPRAMRGCLRAALARSASVPTRRESGGLSSLSRCSHWTFLLVV